MDDDNSPKPSTEGQSDTDTGEPTGIAEAEEPPSIWGRLLGWSANGSGEEAGPMGREALGPAFRNSAPAELAMVANILRLRDLRVEDVMTPRADVVAVAEDCSLQEVLDAFDHFRGEVVQILDVRLEGVGFFVRDGDQFVVHGSRPPRRLRLPRAHRQTGSF